MKLTPSECLDKWKGKRIIIGWGEYGCIIMTNEKVQTKGMELRTRILSFPEAREVLVALIHKKKTNEVTV